MVYRVRVIGFVGGASRLFSSGLQKLSGNPRVTNRRSPSCAKLDAEMVHGSFVCPCGSAVIFLDSREFHPKWTTAVSGAAPSALRSALDSSVQASAD